MNDYTKLNVSDVKDMAPEYGMGAMGEARFARENLGAERIGFTYYRMNDGQRVGFGHRHSEAEEMYFVLSGSGRFRVGEDTFSVGPRDIVYVSPDAMREWEADAGGLEVLAFGAHADDAEMQPGWWAD